MPDIPTFEQKKVVSLFTVLGYLAVTFVLGLLLYRLAALVPPLLVALVIALTLTPEVDRIERHGFLGIKLRRGAAIGVIYFLFLALGTLALRLIPLMSGELTGLITRRLPPQLLHGSAADVTALMTHWMNRAHLPMIMRPPLLDHARHIPQTLTRGMQWLSANLPALAGNLIWIVVVPIIAFFLLLDFNKILGKTLLMVPLERRQDVLKIVTEVVAVFGNWVRGLLLVMGLDIVVVYVVLRLAGLGDYALTLAVVTGILNTIPYFGPLVTTLTIAAVTGATRGLVPTIVVTAALIVIHQIIFDLIIAPRIIGGSVHLHPLLTLLALIAGGTLFGIGGTLLAVPIAAAVQVVLVYVFPQLTSDVVAVRHATHVVQAGITRESEASRPPARKEGDQERLDREAAAARADAELPSPLSPPVLPT